MLTLPAWTVENAQPTDGTPGKAKGIYRQEESGEYLRF